MLSVAVIFVLTVYNIRLKNDNAQLIEKSKICDKQAKEILTTWLFISDFGRTWQHSDRMGVSDMVDYLKIIERQGEPKFSDANLVAIWSKEKEMMAYTIINALQKKTGDNLGNDPNAWIGKYSYDSVKK